MSAIEEKERQRVISAVPKAGVDGAVALARLDAKVIATVAADTSQPWWRRRPCVLALRDRVPEGAIPPLWARVIDKADVGEVRIATLDVLGAWWAGDPKRAVPSRERALDWLRGQNIDGQAYGMDQALVLARCRLGDLEVVPALARLAFDPWHHRIRTAEQATAALLEARSLESVLGALGAETVPQLVTSGATAAARYFGLQRLAEGSADVETLIEALGDRNVVVASRASRDLQALEVDDERLLAVFDEHVESLRRSSETGLARGGEAAAAAWALLAVARRIGPHGLPPLGDPECGERARAVHARLDLLEPFASSHPDVPDDVRRAILETYLPGERTTDPRLLLEGLRLGSREDDDEPENPDRVREALVATGLEVGPPVTIGEVYRQGGGSYSVLDVGGVSVGVCTFGPFVRSEGALPASAVSAVECAGFRWIDEALASVVFEGLPVYFFGSREPLSVGDLLFYWQD